MGQAKRRGTFEERKAAAIKPKPAFDQKKAAEEFARLAKTIPFKNRSK
jgi:hypothetical protein